MGATADSLGFGEERMSDFWQVTAGGLIGSGIASTLAAALLIRRNKVLESEIKRQFTA
jgi:hypothetical protein